MGWILTFWLSESASRTGWMICTKDDVVHRDFEMRSVNVARLEPCASGNRQIDITLENITQNAERVRPVRLAYWRKSAHVVCRFILPSIRHCSSFDGRGRNVRRDHQSQNQFISSSTRGCCETRNLVKESAGDGIYLS